jgi:hypothetical protein
MLTTKLKNFKAAHTTPKNNPLEQDKNLNGSSKDNYFHLLCCNNHIFMFVCVCFHGLKGVLVVLDLLQLVRTNNVAIPKSQLVFNTSNPQIPVM